MHHSLIGIQRSPRTLAAGSCNHCVMKSPFAWRRASQTRWLGLITQSLILPKNTNLYSFHWKNSFTLKGEVSSLRRYALIIWHWGLRQAGSVNYYSIDILWSEQTDRRTLWRRGLFSDLAAWIETKSGARALVVWPICGSVIAAI